MTAQPDLFTPPETAPAPRRRRRTPRRILVPDDPLTGPRAPAPFVEWLVQEIVAATSCERRARCLAKSLTATEDERSASRDHMDAALVRIGRLKMLLLHRLVDAPPPAEMPAPAPTETPTETPSERDMRLLRHWFQR